MSGSFLRRLAGHEVGLLAARLILGGIFIWFGFNKALHPVDFLKVLRQYELTEGHHALNFIAAVLPWFEIVCGALLVGGVGVRGSALLLLGMLVPFSVIVFLRALDIQAASGIALCAIRFDCGCGVGEVVICRKLVENLLLVGLAVWLVAGRAGRWCLRHDLLKAG